MNRHSKVLLIILFPVTAYLFIGTFLFFLATKIDVFAKNLGDYFGAPGLEHYSSHKWHDMSIWLTIFFPVTWPIIFAWLICVFLYALMVALWRIIYALLEAIWSWIVDSVEYIWDTISSVFR